jgi:hypothetical protein
MSCTQYIVLDPGNHPAPQTDRFPSMELIHSRLPATTIPIIINIPAAGRNGALVFHIDCHRLETDPNPSGASHGNRRRCPLSSRHACHPVPHTGRLVPPCRVLTWTWIAPTTQKPPPHLMELGLGPDSTAAGSKSEEASTRRRWVSHTGGEVQTHAGIPCWSVFTSPMDR